MPGPPGLPGQAGWPAAPVDPAAVARALLPFGQSVMLPPAAYTDPAVFAWERRHFFGGSWTCVGFSSELARPGAQRAEAIGDSSVLLTRDEDGGLHAFANFCRHRGHELLACGAAAQGNSIICHYHAWTYNLAGELSFAQIARKHGVGGRAVGLIANMIGVKPGQRSSTGGLSAGCVPRKIAPVFRDQDLAMLVASADGSLPNEDRGRKEGRGRQLFLYPPCSKLLRMRSRTRSTVRSEQPRVALTFMAPRGMALAPATRRSSASISASTRAPSLT